MRAKPYHVHHTQLRALQRYRVKLSEDEYNFMVDQIKNGKAVLVSNGYGRIQVYNVMVLDGIKIKVLYDSRKGVVLTVLR
jgi:hypothetical protein